MGNAADLLNQKDETSTVKRGNQPDVIAVTGDLLENVRLLKVEFAMARGRGGDFKLVKSRSLSH